MVETKDHFTKRLNFLGQKHASMTQGYTTHMRKDGLIVVQPVRHRRNYPVRALVMVLAGFFVLKAFMLAAVGPITYNERLATLQKGTFIERGGAWLMGIDPITGGLASMAGPVLR